MGKYAALDIADEIIRLANEEESNVSQLKLIKICYFVKAWSLVFFEEPIFDDEVQAWMHGPVIPSIYNKFKFYGSSSISYEPAEIIKDAEDKKFIKSVWDVYKKYGAFALRDMTHEEGSPWEEVYDSTLNKKIEDDKIKTFYKQKLQN